MSSLPPSGGTNLTPVQPALTLPETLLPSSTVSPNSDSSSTTSLSSGQSVSGVADDAPLLENQGAQYRCQDCDVNFNHKGFKHKKDLDRHLQTAKVHSMLWFQCGCSYTSTRKDNFRTHIERHKIRSDPIRSITCWCGEIKESSSGLDVDAWIQEHMDPCGQRPRGRPKKEK